MAAQRHEDNEVKVRTSLQDSFDESNAHLFKLGAENIFLGRTASTKEEAIRFAGEQLVKGGYVQPEYVDAMLEREKLTPTYRANPSRCRTVRWKRKTACSKPAWCSASILMACASVKKKTTLPVW